MAKVYCKECEHSLESVAWRMLSPTKYLCRAESHCEDTPLEQVKHYPLCLNKNKDNDCPDFNIKRSRYLKRPMWNQDWGRSAKDEFKEILEGD